MINDAYVFLEDRLAGRRRLYQNPREIITAQTPEDVAGALEKLQECQNQGFYLAGYCAYELGYVFEDKLAPLMPAHRGSPLLQFGVFENYTDEGLPKNVPEEGIATITDLKPDWSYADYKQRFDKVLSWIRNGDVYQVNLTFPMRGKYSGDAAALYTGLKSAQPVSYGGVISLGGADFVSLSPELFYELQNGRMSMRPMKGTVKRGETKLQDRQLADMLQADAKNRAENLMIVDLLRNDLSRISGAGSVKVTDLFSLETYPSLHTMTSGIEADVQNTSFADILRALFPCGSVTGAPKIRAMEIIRELETQARGAYCGALGLIDPNGYTRFNVGIRTLKLETDGQCSYRVGSGVVADSIAKDEYEECLLKASFLQDSYGLIETIGWHKQTGFMWLDLHMNRLKRSSTDLGFSFVKKGILRDLYDAVDNLEGVQKVRLELSKNGTYEITAAALYIAKPDVTLPIALSKNPVSSSNPLLAHKTTRRQFFDGELKRLQTQTGCKEVLFFNETDKLCEGSYTNVFIEKAGQMLTPPIACGLLPGILRQVMLENGEVREQVLVLDDLLNADKIYVGNSVRGLMRAELTNPNRT